MSRHKNNSVKTLFCLVFRLILTVCLCGASAALDADPSYLKARLRRARTHQALGNHQECVYDYEQAMKQSPSGDVKRELREAKARLKQSLRKDYYKLLGVRVSCRVPQQSIAPLKELLSVRSRRRRWPKSKRPIASRRCCIIPTKPAKATHEKVMFVQFYFIYY